MGFGPSPQVCLRDEGDIDGAAGLFACSMVMSNAEPLL